MVTTQLTERELQAPPSLGLETRATFRQAGLDLLDALP